VGSDSAPLPARTIPRDSLSRPIIAVLNRLGPARVVDILFVAYLITIAALRWHAITSLAEPSGLDTGNWLAFGNGILGSHSRSASIVYPPTIPLATVAVVKIWGPLTGVEILETIASLAPAAGTYVLLRGRLGLRAALLAGLLAPAASTGEAAAWGAYPQLVGLGLLALVLWGVDQFVTTRRLRWAFITSAFLLLTLATSDLIGAAAVVIAPLFLALRVMQLSPSDRPSRRELITALLIAVAPSLALVPIYAALAGAVLKNETGTRPNQLTLANLLPTLETLFQDSVELWALALVAAIFSPLVLLTRRGRSLAADAVAILAPTAIALVALREIRLVYLLPIAMVIAVGAWWTLLQDPHRPFIWWSLRGSSRRRITIRLDSVLMTIMAVALVVESGTGIDAFQRQLRFYSTLNPGVVAGLQQLDRVASRNAVLAVGPAPRNGWPFGWWVEGLLDRPTYYACDLQWLNQPDERRRATLANEMFSKQAGISGAIDLARANGIDYIVVAREWNGYPEWASRGSPTQMHVLINTESLLVVQTNG
jgi:hypothetical protein